LKADYGNLHQGKESNSMADRLAASTNTYHTYSLEEALAGIAGAGFTSVELTSVPGWTEHVRRDASPEHIAHVKDELKLNGLTPISLSGHSDLVSDAGVAEFRKALNLCRQLEISMITTSTGGHDASSAGGLDEQRQQFLQRIGPLADEAAADGITICLETHGGLLATGAISADLVRQINKPNVGINYDPGNVIFYGNTRPETDVASAVQYINHMHVKDQIGGAGVWNFPPVGTGEVDYNAIFSALNAAGFNGPCSIEIEFQGEPWPSLDDVNNALAESYKFVRGFVAA
jgi:L-ribulose-5-phosphate 3-epimerase